MEANATKASPKEKQEIIKTNKQIYNCKTLISTDEIDHSAMPTLDLSFKAEIKLKTQCNQQLCP